MLKGENIGGENIGGVAIGAVLLLWVLIRCVNADAEYAAAEEHEDAHPLQYGPTSALSLNLCVAYMSTFLASHLLRLLISAQIVGT